MGRETIKKRQKQLARQNRRMEKAVRLRQQREPPTQGPKRKGTK